MKKLILCFAFFPITFNAAVADMVDMPSTNPVLPPMKHKQVETGKVTHVHKDELPEDMKKFINDRVTEEKEKGYEATPEEFFIASAGYRNYLQQESNLKPKIAVALADIGGTELKHYVYEGIIPEGPTVGGPYTKVTRVFMREDGVVVMLTEWDYVADGAAIMAVKEMMNVKVNNIPGIITIKKSPSGKTMTDLHWSTNKKDFTVSVWEDADKKHKGKKYDREWLLNLAENLTEQGIRSH